MDLVEIEKTRKRFFAYLCFGLTVPILSVFLIVDFLEGDWAEILLNVITILIFFTCVYVLKKWKVDIWVYRFGLLFISVVFLFNVAIGAGEGTAIFWLYLFPLVYLYYLGKKEGIYAIILFFLCLSILLLNQFPIVTYAYNTGTSLRYLASFVLVSLIAYAFEASREKYGSLLLDSHHQLAEEKQHLEQALKELKRLSGLLPICANCKKIRNDKGYWQQVEIYIREHSEAVFSHGICPYCAEKLKKAFKK